MKVLVLSDGELKINEIENTLESLQEIVGGYIEIPFLSRKFTDNNIDIIINEEGKFIDNLTPEIAVVDKKTMEIIDIVYGNCIFASHDEYGETIGLNDEQINIISEELKQRAMIHDGKTNKEYLIKVLNV